MLGRTASEMSTVIGLRVIRFWSVPDEWTLDTGNCMSVRFRPSRCVKNCGSVRIGRGSWWLWCVRAATAELAAECPVIGGGVTAV